jgi:hypothetical protein
MKQFAIALLGVVTLLAGAAQAGVVVEEQQTIDHGGGSSTNKVVVMVQGNKQKYVIGNGQQSSITDLDNGTRTMIIDSRKLYVEMPFPPKAMAAQQGDTKGALSFKPTGAHEKIAGYSCDDYNGLGSLGNHEMTVAGCFSTSAPGAGNFTAFQKVMAEKVKGTPMALITDTPAGIPLKIDTKLTEKGGARPPTVTHMMVSKVEERNLSADTFVPPKGYTKQEIPTMGAGGRMTGPGMMGKPAGGAGAPGSPAAPRNKVPE